MLASLGLPGEVGGHLAARAVLLDGTYREVAGRLPDNAQIVFDDDGRPHFAALEPEPEPASLLELRLATYRAANATLIEHQASIGLATAWGGGLVASVDGMRFVVPVPSVYARPNPKYFGRRGGATWLNTINDQAAGLGGKVVAGTPRDSLSAPTT
ncbi:hypothetical protein SCOCK_210057 [Actinacidiphila cocklensis]|uniref:Tn3 transposase DDE domain-containing protein n=1 Tax=Actinacidiphila cocklensis TaxID=887465 RepID=A0A9W4GQP6_9ACTN|nr:hypothetical protein SCOCK_210057 [Actinacidiphila cocklensis]